MNKRHLLMIPVVVIAIGLAGCASDSKRTVNLNLKYMTASSAPINSNNRAAQAQLSEAASSVGTSLQQLSAIQSATHPHVRMGRPTNPKAIGMATVASINWTGPVAPVVHNIARASRYRFKALGHRPAVPVLVNINVRNQPLAYILRNIRYQVTSKASISVYPKKRLIELLYH